jgi:formylglycine-generating enzyme required for sulfatase activity
VAAVVGPESVPVPGGPFVMGSSRGRPDEAPPRSVVVSGFRLGRTPVTNREYEPFLRAARAEAPPFWRDPAFSARDQPVVGVTWFEARDYAAWLSEVTGRRFRLPSEAEWERAARGGLEGARTAWGEALPVGEVPEGPLAGPWPVAHGTPNGYGLFDMGTIVHEWCLDWYDAEARRRASRGGSWRHHVRWSSPSARSSLPPGFRYADYGFRVLEEP